MYSRDIDILKFFASASEPLFPRETPFEGSEIMDLEKDGFLSLDFKEVPKTKDEKYPLVLKAYSISRKGRNEIKEYEDVKQERKRALITFRLAILSAVLSALTLIVSVMAWLLV